jgi:hypothetical protein
VRPAVHPDEFIGGFLTTYPSLLLKPLRQGRIRFRAPPLAAGEMLQTLERQGLTLMGAALRGRVDEF